MVGLLVGIDGIFVGINRRDGISVVCFVHGFAAIHACLTVMKSDFDMLGYCAVSEYRCELIVSEGGVAEVWRIEFCDRERQFVGRVGVVACFEFVDLFDPLVQIYLAVRDFVV